MLQSLSQNIQAKMRQDSMPQEEFRQEETGQLGFVSVVKGEEGGKGEEGSTW